jgi:hypothetical protein
MDANDSVRDTLTQRDAKKVKMSKIVQKVLQDCCVYAALVTELAVY